MSRTNKWYGWKPDLPDVRDKYQLRQRRPGQLPAKVDLSVGFAGVPVFDQGELGSCTAHAIAQALMFDQLKQGLLPFVPSRLFIYYNERAIEGTTAEDSGAMLRDGIKSVASNGAPAEKLWPYDIAKFARAPYARVYRAAKTHHAVKYERLCQNLPAIKSCLARGFPFVFGFTVYDGFESDEVTQTGTLNMPAATEGVMGGHAVICVGYDNATSRLTVRNSWGADWGNKGYFTMPYDYILNRDLADDLWAIELVK